MPGNTAAGYGRLTQAYRSQHASSRGSYERFWGAIAGVSTSSVSASPPGSVTATVTYRFRDGHVVRERTAYGLVQDGGILKIDSSHVLGSG